MGKNDDILLEILNIVQNEYLIERDKRQSFETRVGIIMALLGVIIIFVLDKINPKYILYLMKNEINFFTLIKILSALIVYLNFLFTMVMLIKTIISKEQSNFDVSRIDNHLLNKKKSKVLYSIIFSYIDIILNHRNLNEKRSKAFKNSLYGIFVEFIFIFIYLFI